jgi:hypothetical protein
MEAGMATGADRNQQIAVVDAELTVMHVLLWIEQHPGVPVQLQLPVAA